ncbi:MAG: hypothetical protein ABJA98_05895 [Acidobacteriota bacterium]
MLTNRSSPLYRTALEVPPSPPAYAQPLVVEPDFETEPSRGNDGWMPSGLLEWFAIGQTALPALLVLPGTQPLRFAIRAGAFLVSLAALGYWWAKGRRRVPVAHPASRWLMVVIAILAVMIAHPDTETLSAGLGQTALYVAVFAPLFWVPAFVTDRRTLIRVLVILLVCNGINSIVGVLQVYDPARWMPKEFSSTYMLSRDLMSTAAYVGPNGRLIIRPPGLYDTPGAVCGAGTVAALLGVIFCLEKMAWWKRILALGFAGAGLAAIYLSQVRSSLMVALGMLAVYTVLLILQQQKARAVALLGLTGGLVAGALVLATLLGGVSIQNRFSTVVQGNPAELYYNSRGNQVQAVVNNQLWDYPFGAGLARWGVMSGYLGTSPAKQLSAEVQPHAWILDGGILLLLAYGLALVSTVLWELKLVLRLPDPDDRLWAAAVVAANVGTLALVFTFVPFATQIGVQFWFLEGLLHGAMTMKLQQWR